jgi:hypothetical protein
MNLTGSLYQIVNGALLMLVFFFVRIVWGFYMSYQFFGNQQTKTLFERFS